jgi:hypothetical protein
MVACCHCDVGSDADQAGEMHAADVVDMTNQGRSGIWCPMGLGLGTHLQ